ncbi:SDR family NAD(P)-dependent oxidoreductase [Flavobacterium ginsengisoli]|uniref:SDR family NAD(P)-dependent oxidoreductase n=1 Tax=Flavobacterium ginsengisoli TaxID=871694 RepID=UPI002415838A|nr:SDR family NAD(P)-dependent oxidoreductase [Flavobacterium ginsengisoli]
MSKTIFITGTSTGFGKLTAVTLANAGHSVIAGMRNTIDKNAAVAKELQEIENIEVVDIDVTDDASVSKAIEKVLVKYGKIDVLINNASSKRFWFA